MAKRKKGGVPVIRLTALKFPERVIQQASPGRIKAIIVLAAVLLLASGTLWYRMIWNEPRRVFQRMLDNSLSTVSITRQIDQSDSGQSLDEFSQIQNAGNHIAHALTTITQGEGGASITTESIGTPTSDYARYIDLATSEVRSDGTPIDFSQILNVWSRAEGPDASQTSGQLFSELSLGIIPFANLPQTDRAEIIKIMNEKQVYAVDYAKGVTTKNVNGRPTYVYSLTVKPEPYVAMLKVFAKKAGFTQLDSIDPALYREAQPIEFDLAVDVRSATLRTVTYKGNNRVENFVANGALSNVNVPTDTISVEELQTRFQSLQ